MVTWNELWLFALPAILCWTVASLLSLRGERQKTVCLFAIIGLLIFGSYIASMWISLKHPPMRTMGETRLWYSLFLPLVGLITYSRWRYRWILLFSTILSTVFIAINILKPEIHSKTLMPALQSPWFAPHVIIYMFAYATTGVAMLLSLWQLYRKQEQMAAIDNLTRVGLSFITIGMLFGALWAKEAWGTYWSWDPKETWAAATWLNYLIYVHLRQSRPAAVTPALLWQVICFLCLQMCWWGINYLPSAQGTSIHVYG